MNMKYELTDEGMKYLKSGLPESNLLTFLKERGGRPISELRAAIGNFDVALNWAKRNGWVVVEGGVVQAINEGSSDLERSLDNVTRGVIDDNVPILIKRNLVRESREDMSKKASSLIGKEIGVVPPELIKTGMWKHARLKPYNVEFVGGKVHPGKKHILTLYKEKIRKIFLDMGFIEAEGPLLESSFWNFDALFVPQDHPSRDMQDTFYMKNPKETDIPKSLAQKVEKMHQSGGSGSTGWGYNWSYETAMAPIMRTHTTSVSARFLNSHKPPIKMFCMGRVFRNETIDYKHLAEFTQVEGIVADPSVNFRNLLGYLKEFYARMGFEKVRFRPAYFPYTEMSVEPEVWMEDKNQWLEMGGAGIFRPEVTEPLGIDCPVLAWGLGLERLPLLKMDLKDLRNFYVKNDLELLRGASVWQ